MSGSGEERGEFPWLFRLLDCVYSTKFEHRSCNLAVILLFLSIFKRYGRCHSSALESPARAIHKIGFCTSEAC
jgi:hypothetical protein